ncbi:hypothetical protein [Methanolobus bombayensis]|uniref:hypothetical protein n=1 Tax=Methanolobus bombayensis TaxID=38023 RepID=UPI001AE2360E|nr:hypothetical protein [Methanolobus bombayensis]MBP1908495.1 hypothetical protein [Methanolobus bombayensis]
MADQVESNESQDVSDIKPEEANAEILNWDFNEVPKYLVYSRRMEMDNPQYILENLNLTGIVHSHSGWRWTKRMLFNGFEYQIDIFENCKFVKEGQDISVIWNDDEPNSKKYRVEMKPIRITKGIIDSLFSVDIQHYKYSFFNKYDNYIFNYKNEIINNINELSRVINVECKSHAANSCNYIRINDLKQIEEFVANLIKIKENAKEI